MSNRASDLADQITSRNSASASRSRFGRDGGNEIRKEDTTSNNTQRVVDRRDDPERRRKHEENRGVLKASGLVLALSLPSWAQVKELQQTMPVPWRRSIKPIAP
jgi:hypothetical protein